MLVSLPMKNLFASYGNHSLLLFKYNSSLKQLLEVVLRVERNARDVDARAPLTYRHEAVAMACSPYSAFEEHLIKTRGGCVHEDDPLELHQFTVLAMDLHNEMTFLFKQQQFPEQFSTSFIFAGWCGDNMLVNVG